MIPQKDWKWFGNPGHFICAQDCRFHLCTLVGDMLVSTVGQYLPCEKVRDIIAESRGVKLEGFGDARLSDFMKKIGYVEIGYGRTFETMVFKAGAPCKVPDCGCGLPEISGSEIDFRPYNDAGEATRGHMEICMRVAEEQ